MAALPTTRRDMEFRRIHDLPPYVFATVDQLKRELRRDGRDVIDLGFGNPDIPSPPIAVEKLCRGRAAADQPSLLGEPRPAQPARRRSASATRRSSASQLDPERARRRTIGAKEGLSHLMWVLVEEGDSVVVPSPALPDPPRRAAPRRRDRHPRADRGRRRPRRDRGGARRRRADAARRDRRRSRTTRRRRSRRPELMQRLVDLAREHEFVLVHDFAYADIAFDGHVPPSMLRPTARSTARSSCTR